MRHTDCSSLFKSSLNRKGSRALPLWQRTYRCPNCGLVMDRDENSAINILKRFFAWLGPHTEQISVRCAGVFHAINDV